MSTEITVQLSDELVAFIDRLVSDGRAPSRGAFVSRALRRELRRELATDDAAHLAATGGRDDDLDDLARHTAGMSLDHLD